jgi:hypothetical protein
LFYNLSSTPASFMAFICFTSAIYWHSFTVWPSSPQYGHFFGLAGLLGFVATSFFFFGSAAFFFLFLFASSWYVSNVSIIFYASCLFIHHLLCVLLHWYVSNLSIIFYAPCLFIHHLLCVLLHFVAFLCIFQN